MPDVVKIILVALTSIAVIIYVWAVIWFLGDINMFKKK